MRLLYNPVPHILLRVVTVVLGAMAMLAGIGMAKASPARAAAGLLLVGGIWIVAVAVVWRTRTVQASESELKVSGFRAPIPIGDVASLERPWWAFNPTFAPLCLVLRDGRRVLFFASRDVEAFLARAVTRV